MTFPALTPRVQKLYVDLKRFVDEECIPAEPEYEKQISDIDNGLQHSFSTKSPRWSRVPPTIETLKLKAQKLQLWNLFLPKTYGESPGLTNYEYGVLCEVIGRSALAPEATNTSAPDTGNMEVLAKYGTAKQKDVWLKPLMNGEIRSAFCMTEPQVASSDATNIETRFKRDGEFVVVNGRKWWISGAGDPRCRVYLVMGLSVESEDVAKHQRQSVLIVPADTPGISVKRPMHVFGYDDAPHGHMEIVFDNVRVPVENFVLGEGRGFEIIQGRLGPGRIHHCMRAIGMAERALDLHILRLTDTSRKTFGKILARHGSAASQIVKSRLDIQQARLLVLHAAHQIDLVGPKQAKLDIAIAKIVVPNIVCGVIDRAIQAYGAAGVSQDLPLARMYAFMRTLRIADGKKKMYLVLLNHC